jgi:hypothetical protein
MAIPFAYNKASFLCKGSLEQPLTKKGALSNCSLTLLWKEAITYADYISTLAKAF